MKHLFLFAMLLAGCADSPVLVLVINSDLQVPNELDEVRVTVTASRDFYWREVCEPSTYIYSQTDSSHFPIKVAIWQGEEFATAIAYRIEGLRDGVKVLNPFAGHEVWPAEGRRDVRSDLLSVCTVSDDFECTLGQHCVDGECVDDGIPQVLDNAAYHAGAPSCHSGW